MKAVIFPGQGTHYAGMWTRMQSRVLPSIYQQVSDALFTLLPDAQPNDPTWLQSTVHAQPTILALSYAYWLQFGASADLLLGHSLGEYTALTAAGAFDFKDALWLVHQRGLAMQPCKGVLYTVIANEIKVEDHVYVSAHNSSKTWNVAAQDDQTIGKKIANYPFHSPLMQPAIEPFKQAIDKVALGRLQLEVISNLTAQPHTPHTLRTNLLRHVTETVRWHESIQYCLERGVKHFVEMGPNSVFSRLLRRDYPQLSIE